MATGSYAQIVISFIGGLGLFLYGMHLMASGLQKSAGAKMKTLLEALTRNKFTGVLIGAFVTGIIQSSSATTVMVVGVVNAGLMDLSQSVGVIMGANIGTTVTAWIASSVEWSTYLKPSTVAPIAVGVGAVMSLFSTKDVYKRIGELVVGFGILFVGMETMTVAVSPLQDSKVIAQSFLLLGSNPFLGVLAGASITAIIQSSSASIVILQSLAASGLVPWDAAVYIIVGQNIGTCITAILSSIGASKNAKSAAYIHLLFNLIGGVVFSILAAIFFTFINPVMGKGLINLTDISIVHTSFNVANTIMLYPFSNVLIYLAQKMSALDKRRNDENDLVHLDDRILQTPGLAIESTEKEIVRLGEMALQNLQASTEALLSKNAEKADLVHKREKNIDTIDHAITDFMVKICNIDINEAQNNQVTSMFHTVNDIERVGDHSENIAELAQFMISESLYFSETAVAELTEIINLTISCFQNSIIAFKDADYELAGRVVDDEESIDVMEKKLRAGHIRRLANNECNSSIGVVFLDTITNLERISDHALNIAEAVFNIKTVKQKTEGRM